MDYFATVKNKCPIPCTHPLLLSLTKAFKENSISLNLNDVSEDDPRVLKNLYYTSAKNFPPMDAHLSGQNGVSLLSESLTFNGIIYIMQKSAAECQMCALHNPPDNLAVVSDPMVQLVGVTK